jgi:hypothetical protein
MARAMAVIRKAALDDLEVAEMQLAIGYTRFGIAGWNLMNGDGSIRPMDGDHLEEFAENDPRSIIIAMRGDALYSQEVMNPLAMMGAVSSPNSSATNGTSRTNGTKRLTRRPKQSKPSSTSITETVGTETTSASLDGDSNS